MRLISIGVIFLALVSCATLPDASGVKFQPISHETIEQTSKIEVFLTTKPTKPYTELGILSYRSYSDIRETLVISKLQAKAEEIDADGIIMLERSNGSSTNSYSGQVVSWTDFRAMAFSYTIP